MTLPLRSFTPAGQQNEIIEAICIQVLVHNFCLQLFFGKSFIFGARFGHEEERVWLQERLVSDASPSGTPGVIPAGLNTDRSDASMLHP